MSKKLGRVTVKADGKVLQSKSGATLDPGGTERTTVVGDHDVGYFEKTKQSKVECEIMYGKETSLDELGAMDNVTLSFECDTGQSYVIKGAWLTDTPQLTAGDGGSVKLVFEGSKAEELKSAA